MRLSSPPDVLQVTLPVTGSDFPLSASPLWFLMQTLYPSFPDISEFLPAVTGQQQDFLSAAHPVNAAHAERCRSD